MTAQTIPFSFEDHLVRVYKPNGEPWFVGRDVCRVLDIKNESDALARLDPDERQDGVAITDPTGREQSVIVVSEPGVFRLIFTSRKPAAERFKRWLAHDVLPSLRKSGQYALPRSAKPAPELVYEFPHAEGPLQVYGLKLATVRECRLVHGPVAAARLWRRLELPAVHASSVYEADEGRACLLHLMSALICDAQMYVLGVFEGALWDNNDEYNAELKTIGLRVIKAPEEGLFVVNSGAHDANIKSVFKGTRWAEGKHVAALRKLPGAMPHKSLQVGRLQHRGTFIPAALIDTIDIGAVIENGDDGADNGADKGNVIDLRPN